MSDSLNQARAMRVTEIISDFGNIQNYIASIRARPSSEEYNEDGYVLLRRCAAESHALLAQPFQTVNMGKGREDDEGNKVLLRRVIADASLRRFKAQKIYLRALAALRWVNARQAILGGQKPQARHAAALGQTRTALRAELMAITDQRVEASLLQPDECAGKWLDEDPSLGLLQRMIASGSSA